MTGGVIESATPRLRVSGRNAADQLHIVVGLEGLALGGCPINAIDLSRRMRDRGHQVEIFAIDEDVPVSLLPVAERAGFDVTILPAIAGGLSRAQQIRRFARQHDAEIIHVYGPWLGPSASVAAVGLRGRACVVTNWTMENVTYTPATATLIVGTRQLEVEATELHRGTVELLEPPVDLEADKPNPEAGEQFRSQWQVAEDDIAVVVVSRLESTMKAESIGHAIRTMQALDDSRLQLFVIGDGDARDVLEREAETVNAALGRRAVTFTGALHDPRPAYAAADITLGMGGSALRALAHAKPLVVVGVNGFARAFEPDTVDYFYEDGFFGVEPSADPVDQLRAEITPLLERQRRRTLGEFGAAEVGRRFGLDIITQKLEAIYRNALAKKHATRILMADGLKTGPRITADELRHRVRVARRGRAAQRSG